MDVPFLTFVQGQPGVALRFCRRRVAVLLLKQADTGKSHFASRKLQDASQPCLCEGRTKKPSKGLGLLTSKGKKEDNAFSWP